MILSIFTCVIGHSIYSLADQLFFFLILWPTAFFMYLMHKFAHAAYKFKFE